ncbi:hypothetical protein [Lishizhenia sp.]|uniref:hypothetical protein n=1 Tax=Lishizhenia sp. TaxID=2497594 RepID=UPI00299D8A23|nr:hypothetical protein [Lishizhenia sp.]MDX1447199.1 hypothetical protein [Lishizhenia sp.]
MITKENYELFYMDYLEGDLDPALTQELEAFLVLHPELQVEDDFLDPIATPQIAYSNKAALKFEALPSFDKMSNEDKIIAYHEGILTKEQSSLVEQLVASSKALQESFQHYAQVYLNQNTLTYPNKGKLKRKSTIILWPALVAVAASFTLLFMMNTQLDTPDVQHARVIPAQKDTNKINTPEEKEELPVITMKDDNPIRTKGQETILTQITASETNGKKKNNALSNKNELQQGALPKEKQTPTKSIEKTGTTHLPQNPSLNDDEVKTQPVEHVEINTTPNNKAMNNNKENGTYLENALPPLVDYALNKVSKKTGKKPIEIKKEENKSLFKGRFKIKIGAIELKKN